MNEYHNTNGHSRRPHLDAVRAYRDVIDGASQVTDPTVNGWADAYQSGLIAGFPDARTLDQDNEVLGALRFDEAMRLNTVVEVLERHRKDTAGHAAGKLLVAKSVSRFDGDTVRSEHGLLLYSPDEVGYFALYLLRAWINDHDDAHAVASNEFVGLRMMSGDGATVDILGGGKHSATENASATDVAAQLHEMIDLVLGHVLLKDR